MHLFPSFLSIFVDNNDLQLMAGKVIKAELSKKAKDNGKEKEKEVSLEAQTLLVETLNDSPHLVSLNGTEWEVRTLRFGTQFLIAEEVLKLDAIEKGDGMADLVKKFANSIPTVIRVLTLCLLNDKKRIFKNGDEHAGYSDEFASVYDTLMWEGNINEYGMLIVECLNMLDISPFMQALDIVQIFKAGITGKKTTMDTRK